MCQKAVKIASFCKIKLCHDCIVCMLTLGIDSPMGVFQLSANIILTYIPRHIHVCVVWCVLCV